jgi:hypothetical protein
MHDLGDRLPSEQKDVYHQAMATLNAAGIPYIVAGAFAIYHYTGSWRNTKDLDIFVTPEQRDAALAALEAAGYRTEVVVESWLSKAFLGDVMIDVIDGSGNWLMPVTQEWIEHGEPVTILDLPVRVINATHMIWSKAYVAAHERFDGADICHLIYRAPEHIDWHFLTRQMARHLDLLAVYVHLYRFVYPDARDHIPDWVDHHLIEHSRCELQQPSQPDLPFRGPLLDRFSYLVDIDEWGLPDPRLAVAEARDIPGSEVLRDRQRDEENFASMEPPK